MKKANFGLGTLAGLLLVCVFAGCLFFTLASGARIYKNISAVMEEQNSARTALGYVTAKLHQSDAAGSVSLTELEGVPALLIRDESEGASYTTFIYCWDGYIMELYCPASESLLPSDGLRVVAARSLTFALSDGLLRVDCETAGGTDTAWVGLRAGIGGAA